MAAAPVCGACSLFKDSGVPLTIFAVAMAAQRHPDVIRAMAEAGHEICSHGYRWIDYQNMDEAQEREHMLEAIRILTEITGERPWAGTPAAPARTPAVWSWRKGLPL